MTLHYTHDNCYSIASRQLPEKRTNRLLPTVSILPVEVCTLAHATNGEDGEHGEDGEDGEDGESKTELKTEVARLRDEVCAPMIVMRSALSVGAQQTSGRVPM